MMIQYAPLDLAPPPLPTSVSAPLAPGFTMLGHLIDENLTHTEEAKYSEIRTWGGSPIATLQDSFSRTINFTTTNTTQSPLHTGSWVFSTPTQRVVVPIGRITHIADSGKITLKAFPDAARNSVYQYDGTRTWEETWHDYVEAVLEGETLQAATLLGELQRP